MATTKKLVPLTDEQLSEAVGGNQYNAYAARHYAHLAAYAPNEAHRQHYLAIMRYYQNQSYAI